MQRKLVILGAAAFAAASLAGCGDHDHSSGQAPPVSTTQSVDTAGVLALAQKPSETSAPFAVDDGAFAITDTSDTSAPIGVNGM